MKQQPKPVNYFHHIITVFFAAVILWQGGFSAAAWCLAGALISALLIFRPFAAPSKFALIASVGFFVAYISSAVLNGSHAEGFVGVMKLAVIFLCGLLLFGAKLDTDDLIFKAGMVAACVGLLTFGGWLPLSGMTVAGRLFGIFQYANATGLFLAVCAFLTRLSEKRASWAVLMETALVLTQSVGALGVYILGWILYRVIKKEPVGIHVCGMILAAVLAAGILGIVNYTPAPWLAPLIPVAYIAARKPMMKLLTLISQKKWISIGAVILAGTAAMGLLVLRQFRPLYTFLERAVQMTDGFRAMLSHPFGIGPGAWAFTYRAYQSADYSATVLHCGYLQIGLDGGFIALICVLALIGYWLYKQKMGKYTVAALMIFIHAAQDISFSFLAIILLLLLCVRASLPEARSKRLPQKISVAFALPMIACIVLFIPETVKNQAAWLANTGQYEAAAAKLETGFLLPNDTDAALKQMADAAGADNYLKLDSIFAGMPNPNAEAYDWEALSLEKQKRYTEAADAALRCIQTAPYWQNSYTILNEILPNLSPAEQANVTRQMDTVKGAADKTAHPFAKYIGESG